MAYAIETHRDSLHFTGRLLAHETSYSERHANVAHTIIAASRHDLNEPSTYAPKGTRCSACRWFEVGIYERHDFKPALTAVGPLDVVHATQRPVGFVVHTRGVSTVPGEDNYGRIIETVSPHEVIEVLTMRNDGDPFIPTQSARALARASHYSEDLRDAYVNRAVV